MKNYVTIPYSILEQIEKDQPRLKFVIESLRKQCQSSGAVKALEKEIANNYLHAGERTITASELWSLSKCCIGGPYCKTT